MYIHYARIIVPTTGAKIVQLLFCSKDHLDYSLTEGKNKAFISKYDWQQFCIPVVSMLQQIPSTQKVYDQTNKVYSIFDTKWDGYFDKIKNNQIPGIIDIAKALGFQFKSWENIYTDLIDKVPEKWKESGVPDASEFFYDNDTERHSPQASELSKEDIEKELKNLLEINQDITFSIIQENDLKKMYRKAAMKFHPDLNGGDSSKMTNLNYYWQQYQNLQKVGIS